MKNQYKIKFSAVLLFLFLSFGNSFSQLSGTYTIGTGGNYITITSAVNALVSNGVNGVVIFNILSGTYRENVTIDSISGSSAVNTITFQSQTGIADDVMWKQSLASPQTLLILNKADNITFKNIYFHNDDNNFSAIYAIYLNLNCDNINIIHNKIVSPGVFNSYGIFSNNSSTRYLTIEENFIQSIISIDLTASVKSYATKILNNTLSGGGINIYNNDSLQIEKNVISTYNGFMFPRGPGIFLQNCDAYLNISKNKIVSDGDARFSPNSGIRIQNSICQNSLIANNMIYYVAGQGLSVSNSTNINIYFNTIQSLIFYNGNITAPNLILSNCTNCIAKNNILGGTHTAFDNQSNSSLSSDYNSFYFFNPIGTAKMLYYNGTGYNDLTQFRTASNSDFNSIYHEVFFVSNTDLHLTATSIGDESLAGVPISGITDDIDGDARSAFFPYKGADESNVTLPVELSSFSSSVTGRNVLLNWSTLSEINNSGFDIERTNVNDQISDDWKKIGFVKGNGTTTSGNNYSFTDRSLNSGKYKFRLKQFDFNGNYEYYNLRNEVIIGNPGKYSLSQNYPNPFNPVTKISYELPIANYVNLKIYDLTGKEIVNLVNEEQNAGSYSVDFDGSKLASGTYFYTLETENYKETKRMILLK